MKKQFFKVFLSMILVVALCVSMSVTAFAAGSTWVTRFSGFQAISAANGGNYPAYVKALQRFLQVYSLYTHDKVMNNGGLDGWFGTATKEAVEYFQAENGLGVDGVAGTNTWGKIGALAIEIYYSSTTYLFKYQGYSAPESTVSYYIAKADLSSGYWYFRTTNDNGNFLSYYFHSCA